MIGVLLSAAKATGWVLVETVAEAAGSCSDSAIRVNSNESARVRAMVRKKETFLSQRQANIQLMRTLLKRR